jgi:predicted transcriptional regulator of viral defense system
VYRLSALPAIGHLDLVTVSLRVPRAIVCLVSALSYHDITTEVPHEVQLALPRGTKAPRLDYPPLRVFRFSGLALTEGVQTLVMDGVQVRVYSAEKTVADCFRFRNKIGIEVAIEALDLCIRKKRSKPSDLLRYARVCQVEKIMLPYLQARQ